MGAGKFVLLLLIVLAVIFFMKASPVQQQSVVDTGRGVGNDLLDFVKGLFQQARESAQERSVRSVGRPRCLNDGMCGQFGVGVRCDNVSGECFERLM